MRRLCVTLISGLLLAATAGCGDTGSAGTASTEDTATAVAVSREVVDQADASAARYGKEHLGHYLKLKSRHLRGYGLDVPEGVSVEVSSTHNSYCIRVTNRSLPSIHAWRIGTIGSRDGEGSSADHCRK